MIYFLQDAGTLNIKIGFVESDSPEDAELRRRNLQTGSPCRLVPLAFMTGNRDYETALHHRFAEHHVRGEWFRPVPALLQLICRAARYQEMTAEQVSRECRAAILARCPEHFALPMGA